MRAQVTVNERTYPWPKVCAIAICLDGCEPAYLDVAIANPVASDLLAREMRCHS